MDLIDRQAAIEHLRNNIAYMRAFGCDRAITLIREVPSVQPEERTDKRAETHACDLISRQAAIDAVADGIISEEESLVECARECNSMIEWAVEALKELPSAQPERKKGKWIHERLASTTGGTYPVTRCSECKNAMPFEWEAHYCPNCGAYMGQREE